MAIDYNATRSKVNELNRSAIKFLDMLTILEAESVSGEPLSIAQLDNILSRLKSEADNLKAIAGEIKTLINSKD